jgi:hypothetical protein
MVNLLSKDPWDRIEASIWLMYRIAKDDVQEMAEEFRNTHRLPEDKKETCTFCSAGWLEEGPF